MKRYRIVVEEIREVYYEIDAPSRKAALKAFTESEDPNSLETGSTDACASRIRAIEKKSPPNRTGAARETAK